MAYDFTTDFLALLRSTGGGVRTERMPGLDYVISALGRSALFAVSVGQVAPTVNQATTVWFKPAIPSWSAEGVIFLWNPTVPAYQVATPALWSLLLSGGAPSGSIPLMDATPGVVGVSLAFARADHVHPTDTTRAPLASPVFTGAPQAPTPTPGDSSTNVATTAFVANAAGVQVPLGGVVAFCGTAAPSANFAIPNGQAISRTAFAAYFAQVGILFGAGDGVNTFNIPDLRGRVIAGVDGGANRLPTPLIMSSQALAGIGGQATQVLLTGNLPPYTPAGTVASLTTDTQIVKSTAGFASSGAGGGAAGQFANVGAQTQIQAASTGTLTGTAQGGTSNPVGVVQPTMELNYLIRVL
jgi:microcystin-dependent protein